ncbi:thioredoxin domain-containing protein 15 [Chanos chanos]|uniref:Thioredoxin domain-containing protein 15 n=1 Tax=Chanos chanos TaxID=29144 RepID=A0A6J2WZR9_CHACN|nr:thioredoxin domain-containing protein 15 [Chanos chanos]
MGWKASLIKVLCTFSLTAYTVGLIQVSAETTSDEVPEFRIAEDSNLDSDKYSEHVEVEQSEAVPERLFKTAEIADALMGTSVPANTGIEKLIPKGFRDSLEARTATAPCDDNTCGAIVTSDETLQALTNEQAESVTLGTVLPDTMVAEEQNSTEMTKTYKVNCDRRNITGISNFTVQVLNGSQDLMEFLNANSSECSLVLFYTTWCQFSANLAPHFNALPRLFPTLHFLALDASQHSSLSTRFGTVAVPNILLFQGVKPMARFNQTDRTLGTLSSFIANQTGFEAGSEQVVRDEDYLGPLPNVPVKGLDWLLVFSVLFITGFTVYAILRTDSIRWLLPGQEHEHQD